MAEKKSYPGLSILMRRKKYDSREQKTDKSVHGKESGERGLHKICGGSIYGLLGPNGSGKTTWMKMMTGFVKPTQGEVIFDGAPWNYRAKNQVAYMSTEHSTMIL